MAISLYEVSVGTYLQLLQSVLGVLAKGEAFMVEQGGTMDDLLQDRLAEDMLPMEFQLRSIVHHSLGCIKGVQAGLFQPPANEPNLDYATLKGRIENALADLKAMKPEEVEALAGKSMKFKMGSLELPFKAEGFVLSFSLPNFYFHTTTCYDLLRKRGVKLAKRDYLGQMKLDM